MSLTARVLIALAAGLGLGAALSASGSEAAQRIPGYLEPLGTMWVNALRMVVIPLVMSAVVVGVTSLPDSRSLGRLGGRAFIVCLTILVAAAAYAVLIGPIVLAGLPIDPATAAAMRASAAATSETAVRSSSSVTGLGEWMIALIPANPIRAMSDGAMLPLIIFTLLFALAITRIEASSRAWIVSLFNGILAASLKLVSWVLAVAPIGVFALTVPLASRLGMAAAGAVLYFVVAVSAMLFVFMLVLYLAAFLIGKQSARAFARACAPAQAVAVSSRASLATLPAMLQGADALGLPLSVRSFFLPLAAATFRTGSAIAIPVGVLFLARLHGIDLGAGQLATIALMGIATTFSVPSIPGGTIIVMVPVLLAADLPVSAVGLLLGVDTIPDMFRTATHVTADMTAASILARGERADPSPSSG